MKNNFFEEVISMENLLHAWKEFRKGKSNKKDVQMFQLHLMDNTIDLHISLKNYSYTHGPYHAFNISDPKPRNIHKATVRDRLLHHAVYRVLYPYFDKKFISDSYSCRSGKGTHRATERFKVFGRKLSKNNTKQCFILKCDVRKFFASIDHKILLTILKSHNLDGYTLWLLNQVISSFETDSLKLNLLSCDISHDIQNCKKGLPLGNLTSQLLVNIYMNEFDQYVKHTLKLKYYIRYADDFVIFSPNKNELVHILRYIVRYLDQKLKLSLHPNKIYIRTLSSGVDFLGWVHFPTHRVLRTSTKNRILKKLKDNPNSEALRSYLGLLKWGNTEKIKSHCFNQLKLAFGLESRIFVLMTYKKKTLKNGMRIVVVPIKGAPSVTVMSMVEAGSEYEAKDKNGISHFLEHMFFKGTKNRPSSLDISKEFDGMGAEHNAFTSNEITAYYGKSASKNFEKILDIISDMYINPTFPEMEMEKEKGVIIEEINMYEDLPQRKVHEVLGELMYGDTTYGWSIAGPKENITNMKIEDFLNYRKTHYVAEKTLVVVAGDVNPTQAFKKIEKAFKGIQTGKRIKKAKVKELQSVPQIKIKSKETDQSHLAIGFRAFDLYDKRMPTLKVLSTILGGGMSSRLFQKMREELGICYYIRSGINDFTDHGNFVISAGVDKSRLENAVEGILAELRKVLNEKVSADELRKAKDYIIGRMYLDLESSDSLAGFYGFQEIMREKIKTPKEVEKEIEKVTAGDIQKLAKQIFTEKSMSLAIVGKVKEEEKVKKLLRI